MDHPTSLAAAGQVYGLPMGLEAISVRPATPADSVALFSLVRALADYEKLAADVAGSAELLGEHLFGKQRYAEALVGDYRGRTVGYALFFHSYSTFLTRPGIYLEDLFVLPELRGRGVGRALLAGVAALARERGCARLEWSVLDWNEDALGFYRSLGAEPVKGWTVYRLSGERLDQLAHQG